MRVKLRQHGFVYSLGTASKDAVLFYFLRFSPLLPLKSYLVFPFQKQYPYFSVRKCKKGHFLCGFAALNQYPYCRLLLILYRTFIRSDVTLGRLQYDFLTTFFDFFTSSIELANNSPFDPRCSSSSLRLHDHKHPRYVDPNRCIGCGICTTRCFFDAIHLVRSHPEFVDYCSADNTVKKVVLGGVRRAGKIVIKSIKERI